MLTLRPQQRHHDRADDAKLREALGEIGERLTRKHPAEASRGRNPRKLRLDRFDREHKAVLHEVAGNRGNTKEEERNAERADDLDRQRFHQCSQCRTVGPDLIGFGEQAAKRGFAGSVAIGAANTMIISVPAGDHEPGIHFRAFDDVAGVSELATVSARTRWRS